jgi:two-component system, LuxR family, response regulator FixJ
MPAIENIIAIIDDDESVRHALRRLVQSAGWKALPFASAEEFLQAPARPPPSCLILDMRLPGLSGLELKQQLDAAGRILPVIFITAFASEQIREQALQAGAVAFLSKPFEEQALLNALALAAREFGSNGAAVTERPH